MAPSEEHASVIYANEMARLKEGHALWIPEGSRGSATIQHGDVGFIDRNGAFSFLFSVDILEQNNEARNMDRYVPENAREYFDFGSIGNMIKTIDTYLKPDLYKTATVKQKKLSGATGGGFPAGANAEINAEYSIEQDRGATCWLPEPGVLVEVDSSKTFKQYILRNLEKWYDGIKDNVDITLEDLVIIKGTIQSPQFKVVAIQSEQGARAAGVSAGVPNIIKFGAHMSLSITGEQRHRERSLLFPGRGRLSLEEGQPAEPLHTEHFRRSSDEAQPLRSSATSPQSTPSIFLRYFKIKKRLFIVKTLKANAGPHSLPPGEDPSSDSVVPVLVDESDVEKQTTTAYQPVDALLDYILEACPEADYAIACDEDINSLFLGEELPEDILASLHDRCSPHLIVIDDRKVGSLNLEDAIRRERIHKITGWPASALLGDALPDIIGSSHSANVNFRDSAGNDKTIRWPHQHLSQLEKARQQGSLKAMATSPDGKFIAAGFDDAAVIFWELSTGTVIEPSSVHEDSVYALAFSPNGTEIASGSADTRVTVRTVIPDKDGSGIDIDNGALHILEGHETDVTMVVYSPDGARLVSGSLDGVLKIWDVSQEYALLLTINNMTCPHWVSFTPDSTKIVATMDDTVVVWDTTDGKTLVTMRGHEANIYMADISHDGARVATVSEDQTARVWDIETGDELLTLHEHSAPVWCVAFSPDDSELVMGSDDATIVIADSWQGQKRASITEHGGSVNTVAYSRNGEWICAGTIESNVALLDARSGQLVAKYEGHEDKIRHVAFSPEADSIISSSDDGTVRTFSVTDVLRLR